MRGIRKKRGWTREGHPRFVVVDVHAPDEPHQNGSHNLGIPRVQGLLHSPGHGPNRFPTHPQGTGLPLGKARPGQLRLQAHLQYAENQTVAGVSCDLSLVDPAALG